MTWEIFGKLSAGIDVLSIAAGAVAVWRAARPGWIDRLLETKRPER